MALRGNQGGGMHPADAIREPVYRRCVTTMHAGTVMISTLRNRHATDYRAPGAHIDTPLRHIARRAVRVWFNHERLDQVLVEHAGVCPQCELLYAIDSDGRQVSSNIRTGMIDPTAFGQDLSRRPYSISLAVLSNAAFQGAFVCDTYLSQVTRAPCVTVMYGVTSGQSVLGFIAADFAPASLETPVPRARTAHPPHGLRA